KLPAALAMASCQSSQLKNPAQTRIPISATCLPDPLRLLHNSSDPVLQFPQPAVAKRKRMGYKRWNPGEVSPARRKEDRFMPIGKKAAAEFIGTFWLVFGGCGSAVLAAAFPGLGIGFVGVALAFGLTVLTMAFAIGHISGCHLNPAVSVGLLVGRRFPASELLPYVIAQVLGGIAGAGVLYVIASGKAGFDVTKGFASNGYDIHSPGGYSMVACLVAEIVLTFMFLMIILGATDKRAPQGFAPI